MGLERGVSLIECWLMESRSAQKCRYTAANILFSKFL